MSLPAVIQKLQKRPDARSLRSLRGVSKSQTPRNKLLKNNFLCPGAESAESDSYYAHAQARAHARARDGELGYRVSADSGDSVRPLPSKATVLKLCRCIDCHHFNDQYGFYTCNMHIGGTAVSWSTGKRICSPAPDQWHYCAKYHGQMQTGEVYAWRKQVGTDQCRRMQPETINENQCKRAQTETMKTNANRCNRMQTGENKWVLPQTGTKVMARGTDTLLSRVCFTCPVVNTPINHKDENDEKERI